jgi:hypothetical protein
MYINKLVFKKNDNKVYLDVLKKKEGGSIFSFEPFLCTMSEYV